ncbi:PiggyBac transposable element-derived protein 4 [Plakobranchus ocellatus]|uniref:PiggyBac transposable element-derived protein 4 n=1 Tax=Plakobranchus ocellatus TaxID=259542 RepID=A0AAV4DT30_9GAST|nr:PiggyBac transposable element-derived protein 4 [Plakobranchus ocellatus]
MSLKRSESILWNFHVSYNADDDGSDPLFKLRPCYTYLKQKFLEAYSLSQNLSFDEAICPYKGRLRFKVYNPMKPTKFGIKIYEVTESDSGYLLGMNTGSTAETTFHELVDLSDECSTTTKIVVGLLAFCGLLNKGHHVYLDNYYNSPELFEELTLLGTGACGTIRANRKNMPTAKIKLDPGESVYRQKDNVLALKFHDKRDVNMLNYSLRYRCSFRSFPQKHRG